jgi:hypothetical protein
MDLSHSLFLLNSSLDRHLNNDHHGQLELDRHKEAFAKNHRMSQQLFGLNRLSDLPELKERAQEVLEGLQKGTI